MSLHMIASFDTADFEIWHEIFEKEKGEMKHAGLHPIKVMHEADAPQRVWVLFEVEDRTRAETWLAADAATGRDRSGIANQKHTFLQLA